MHEKWAFLAHCVIYLLYLEKIKVPVSLHLYKHTKKWSSYFDLSSPQTQKEAAMEIHKLKKMHFPLLLRLLRLCILMNVWCSAKWHMVVWPLYFLATFLYRRGRCLCCLRDINLAYAFVDHLGTPEEKEKLCVIQELATGGMLYFWQREKKSIFFSSFRKQIDERICGSLY